MQPFIQVNQPIFKKWEPTSTLISPVEDKVAQSGRKEPGVQGPYYPPASWSQRKRIKIPTIAASCGSHEVTIRWHSLKHFFFFLTYTVKQVFALDNSFQFFFFFWKLILSECGSGLKFNRTGIYNSKSPKGKRWPSLLPARVALWR